jgi:hypothetical protein
MLEHLSALGSGLHMRETKCRSSAWRRRCRPERQGKTSIVGFYHHLASVHVLVLIPVSHNTSRNEYALINQIGLDRS